MLLPKSKTNSACNALQGPQTKTLPPPLAYLLNASPAACALRCRLFWARWWCPHFLISRFSAAVVLPWSTLLGAVLQSITRGRCRASFCHLAAGQPVMSSCPGCWFWLSCCLGAALVPVLAVVVVPPCAACRASTKSHGRRPSIYREGEPTEGWGNPEGVPRPQAANGVSIFRRWSSYPQRGQVLKI